MRAARAMAGAAKAPIHIGIGRWIGLGNTEIAAISSSTLLDLSPAEYFGGIKGDRYVLALIAYSRQGGFCIA